MKESFIFALWLKRHRPNDHPAIVNKLDGIFNQRYPVYHLKDDVVKFSGTSKPQTTPRAEAEIGRAEPAINTFQIPDNPVKARTDIKPDETKAQTASQEILAKSVKLDNTKSAGVEKKSKLGKISMSRCFSPAPAVPTFENQDDVNLYIARLLSQNEALKQEVEIRKQISIPTFEEEEEAELPTGSESEKSVTIKEASTEVAKLRVQIGEWQKEIIRKEKEAKETQSKWLKQIQGWWFF